MEPTFYRQLTEAELYTTLGKHQRIIQEFLEGNEYAADHIIQNTDSLFSMIAKVDQRRQYFSFFHHLDMSEYKEAALNAFWCIKLAPLSADSTVNNCPEYDSINEKLALFYILKTLRCMLIKNQLPIEKLDSLPQEYMDELVYTLTYRDISKEALVILVETMAVFLGLEPYQRKAT